ncbi:hypothetical protein Q9L58_005588 [Maublancomyces gigas]|uniref:Uncharacterized protein n=1 Tax=Discina gigas TaxID=1032678 RepID=A0ABR3GI62_9PEZI
MLYIYTGKINYKQYATDTIIRFMVPKSKEEHYACLAYWQLAVEGSGATNINVKFTGQFQKMMDEQIKIQHGHLLVPVRPHAGSRVDDG